MTVTEPVLRLPFVGTRVRKTKGEYTFEGEIIAVYYKRDGVTCRYSIEDDRGLILIMNGDQFEVIP